ncbi:MAG: HlyD family efflux transporter periplasmic adaptor subunit [Pseudomonadales bacterium]|nr:HlyD family efflux transporter periplasmic adaptor subunit [Pseudomonadales bacterium]
MLSSLRNHPVLALMIPLIAGLLVWGFWPRPVLVEAITVSRGPMAVTIEEEGRTRVIDRYLISAPVNGITCRQQLNVGDSVEKDQILLSITPLQSQVLDPRSRAQAKAKVSAAQSALRAANERANAAEAAEQLALDEHKRLQPLVEQSLISRDVFDRATTETKTSAAARRSADFNVEVARYELEAARTVVEYSGAAADDLQVEKVEIRSPINGRILKVKRECEGPVQTGEPLLEIGDPTALEVEVDLLSADAVKIKPGMRVLFERWGGNQTLKGIVNTIEPVGVTKISALGVEEQRVLVISEFTSASELWNRLGDGYRVEARFILWQQDQVLQIPASSLFRYNEGWAVFVIDMGRAKRRMVKIGKRNGLTAQIIGGIKDGESVINHPSDKVEENRSVKIRNYL